VYFEVSGQKRMPTILLKWVDLVPALLTNGLKCCRVLNWTLLMPQLFLIFRSEVERMRPESLMGDFSRPVHASVWGGVRGRKLQASRCYPPKLR
jgi:hypothetical protein